MGAAGGDEGLDLAAVSSIAATKAKDVAYDKERDPLGLWNVYQKFDADNSGAVDLNEMKTMVKALGMIITDGELAAMINEADEDKSGQIEFNEFVFVIKKAATSGATTAGGGSFAGLIMRQANSIPMKWRLDRVGYGIVLDGATATFKGKGHAVALLDPWMPGDLKYNLGSLMLKVVAPAGTVYVGVVGKNFNPAADESDPVDWWNADFFHPKSPKKMLVTACRSTDGAVWVNGAQSTTSKARPFGTPEAPRVQINILQDDHAMQLHVLPPEGSEPLTHTSLEGLKPEVAVAVCFCPVSEGGAPSTVEIVGSSCERVPKRTRRVSRDLWDDENVAGLSDRPKAGVGMEELNGQ